MYSVLFLNFKKIKILLYHDKNNLYMSQKTVPGIE